jgi:hypothetical protein
MLKLKIVCVAYKQLGKQWVLTPIMKNKPYSKIDKSTGAKVAVIFAHFRFGVIFCYIAKIKI